MGPSLREAMRATFIALARGGVTTEYFNVFCYVDYTVSEYLLGAGPTQVTLVYDTTEKAYSYDLFQTAHESGAFELVLNQIRIGRDRGDGVCVWRLGQ